MFKFENLTRIATAAVGALALATLTVAAAAGPVQPALAHVASGGTAAHG